MEASIKIIPNFVQAKTADKLRESMLALQLKHQKKLRFFDIQYVNGKWIAWYELDFIEAEQVRRRK